VATYVNGAVGTLLEVSARLVGELRIPGELLRAVELAPVPVGAHHGGDEGWVILVRGRVVLKGADFEGGRGDGSGGCESGEGGGEAHLDVEL
jgi:hypothetical protein